MSNGMPNGCGPMPPCSEGNSTPSDTGGGPPNESNSGPDGSCQGPKGKGKLWIEFSLFLSFKICFKYIDNIKYL